MIPWRRRLQRIRYRFILFLILSIAFEAVIKQCYEGFNRSCQNPDSVIIEYTKLQNEFSRVSEVAKEEVSIYLTHEDVAEEEC